MTVEQLGPADTVLIRAPRFVWMGFFLVAGPSFVLAVGQVWLAASWFAMGYLFAGCLAVAGGLWVRSTGVALTTGDAIVRGVRARTISSWQEVQAVVRYERAGAWYVQLFLESGKPVTLPAPSSTWGFGGDAYERDFHRIGQYWLAHRGESWRPLRPEAPKLPVQESGTS